MFTVFVMSIVHLPFYQLATLYTHLISHVLSKKIKRDFLHGRAINFWHTRWSLFIRCIKLHLTFLSNSMLVTSIKKEMKIFFFCGQARPVTPIFLDATSHTSPSCYEHTNRPFRHSCKQGHQLEAQADKIKWFVWNCPPKPRHHFFMFARWRVMQKRSITPLLQNFFWLEKNKMIKWQATTRLSLFANWIIQYFASGLRKIVVFLTHGHYGHDMNA